MTFAFVFDAGPFRVRKYESVVIGFDIRVDRGLVLVLVGDVTTPLALPGI